MVAKYHKSSYISLFACRVSLQTIHHPKPKIVNLFDHFHSPLLCLSVSNAPLFLLCVNSFMQRNHQFEEKKAPTMSTNDPILCYQVRKIISAGVFAGHNPLAFSVPIMMLQLSLSSFAALFFTAMFKPLGVPVMISQILAGIVLGPSVLGTIESFTTTVFPERSLGGLETFTLFGAVFYMFLIGVQMDLRLVKSGRKSLVIGTSVVMLALVLSLISAIIVCATMRYDTPTTKSLIMVAIGESMVSFPVVAYVLSQIKIVHSEFSIVALSSAMVSSVICFSLVAIVFAISIAVQFDRYLKLVKDLSLSVCVVMGIVFILQPLLVRMITNIPVGQTMKEGHMCLIFLSILLLAYTCSQLSMHLFIGPFILGLVIPSGPPIGPALLERLEFFILQMVMPIFYIQHGMTVNLFSITRNKLVPVVSIVFINCTAKFLGAFLPSLYYNMSSNDAVLLGLTMNVQGFLELSVFKLMKDSQLIEEESFQIMCISLLVITGTFIPLVRSLYKSSRTYVLHRRRTIEHSPVNTELRVLACVHEQENVPSIIHLLKASHPTENSPIRVSVIHFMELVGRATPMLVSHKVNTGAPASTATSQRIINVFRRYEENNLGMVTVHPFTMSASYETMHDNVCMLAFNRRTSLIILPFHRQYTTGIINTHSKIMNSKVLDNAPCSVGILVDRGLLGGYKFVLANWLSYNVVIIFLGGADDREALAYGLRMSEHPNIKITIIRFLDKNKRGINEMNRILDDAAVNDFKTKTTSNDRISYHDEEVVDREGVMDAIESMEGKFELVIMGRRHDKDSLPILGSADCKNCTELGTLGDAFISEEFGGRATILVLQQQINLRHTPNNFAN